MMAFTHCHTPYHSGSLNVCIVLVEESIRTVQNTNVY